MPVCVYVWMCHTVCVRAYVCMCACTHKHLGSNMCGASITKIGAKLEPQRPFKACRNGFSFWLVVLLKVVPRVLLLRFKEASFGEAG